MPVSGDNITLNKAAKINISGCQPHDLIIVRRSHLITGNKYQNAAAATKVAGTKGASICDIFALLGIGET